jgi:hypothetical protein
MKTLIIAALLLLALPALAGPALTPDGPTVTIQSIEPQSANFICTPGNPYNANAAGYYNFYNFTESYATLFDPASCPTCDLGTTITRVRMLLRLNAAATFQISASLAEAIDTGNGCFAPGAVVAQSGAATVSGITAAGGYYINLNWTSPCLEPGYKYFLIFNLGEPGALVAGPYVDNDGVTACNSWHNSGTGWVNIASMFVGDPFVWAETDCCLLPVPEQAQGWGTIKSLFR